MNEKKIIIPCLFDYKDFFKKKGHKYFPGLICFPQFFAISINTILSNIIINNEKTNIDAKNLCYSYFDILPILINHLFSNYKIEVDVNKLIQISKIAQKNKKLDNDYILLEMYLKDDTSIQNYRKALLDSVLHYHKCETLDHLINHLHHRRCCSSKENIYDSIPPSSEHYILLGTRNNNSNIISSIGYETLLSTYFWGPFYWNIFHSIAEKCNSTHFQKKLLDFLYIIPYTLPCPVCRNNFILQTKYFETIIENYSTNNNIYIKELYCQIHDEVNYKIQ